MAQTGLQAALAISFTWQKTASIKYRRGDKPVDQADLPGASVARRSTDLVRDSVTGLFGRGADSRQVHGASQETALTDVQDLLDNHL